MPPVGPQPCDRRLAPRVAAAAAAACRVRRVPTSISEVPSPPPSVAVRTSDADLGHRPGPAAIATSAAVLTTCQRGTGLPAGNRTG